MNLLIIYNSFFKENRQATDEEIKEICRFIATSPTLKKFEFVIEKITSKQFELLYNTLSQSNDLESISITISFIENAPANLALLINKLKNNNKLKNLKINITTEEELESLRDLCKINPNISLTINSFYGTLDELANLPVKKLFFARSLTVSRPNSRTMEDSLLGSTLQEIWFSQMSTEEDIDYFIESLKKNTSLTSVSSPDFMKAQQKVVKEYCKRNQNIIFLHKLALDIIEYSDNNIDIEPFEVIAKTIEKTHDLIDEIKTLWCEASQLEEIINRLFDFYSKNCNFETTLRFFWELSIEEKKFISNEEIINFMCVVQGSYQHISLDEWELAVGILCLERFNKDRDAQLLLYLALSHYLLPDGQTQQYFKTYRYSSLYESIRKDNVLFDDPGIPILEPGQDETNEEVAKNNIIDYFKLRITPQGKMIKVLDNYLQQRQRVRDDKDQIINYYYGSFFGIFQKSYDQKNAAVRALRDALKGKPGDLLIHLSVLRNGELGKNLRAFIKAGYADNIVNGATPKTVTEFVTLLHNEINSSLSKNFHHTN